MARAVIVSVFALLVACTSGELRPADLQPGTACAYCRMTLVDPKLASQIVAPGEEPRVFDDLGCGPTSLNIRSRASRRCSWRTIRPVRGFRSAMPCSRRIRRFRRR